ncbi:UNVERIFIED_CONTAM: hypothetical protein H355_015863, partial [Colinus virginianus]
MTEVFALWISGTGRITKPLTFADCVGDELPLGWETVYDQQIGVYYMDHINQLTQIEDPREQWRREQERMLKEYLIVAQEALNAKKEIYQIKQQRFELAQEEYQQLHKMCEDDNRSYASSFSGFSTNTKYDPYQIKAEIASRRDRLSRLKRELAQMKQELQYKEKGVETLQEIDRKMSSTHTNYRLDEAQAIMSELRTIKKAICTGEKERQDLMQSLAKLTDGFRNSCCITDSLQDLQHNSSSLSDSCLPQQHCDACSQTDITGEFGFDDKTRLVDKVRLNWQYEEAKKRVSSIQQQLALLDNESWPGMAEADRDRLQLIKEKEALLQELQLISQQRRSPEDIARLEEEKRRLEDEIQRARATSAHGATESLSASTLTMSSGSSRGSLASSRGSLASSRGSLSSVSFTDIYGLPQYDKSDSVTDYGQHLRFDIIPFESLTKDVPYADPIGHSNFNKQRRSLDTPQSLASLSSRSSLSSLSPPSSPLDTPFLSASRDSPLAQMSEGFEEMAGMGALEMLRAQTTALGDDDTQGTSSSQMSSYPVDSDGGREMGPQLTAVQPSGAVTLRGDSGRRSERRARRVSACLSDHSLASDSGVFEALSKRNEDMEEPVYGDLASNEEPQIHVGFLHDSGSECLLVHVLQLKNFTSLVVKENCKIHVRVYLPPLESGTPTTYCSRALEFQTPLIFNEVFRIPVHSSVLKLKSLQLYICSVDHQQQEELLGIAQINLSDLESSGEMQLHWYSVQIFTGSDPQRPKNKNQCEESIPRSSGNVTTLKTVDKETNTEDLFPEEVAVLPKERTSRRPRGSAFVRSSTIVRSQTFSPGARSQYVCRLYRSDSDSSTLPRKSPFVRNTLERRTLRYKQQSCRSSLAELMARTSLDLELDLQASRTRQRQLNEEICVLRELRQRLEDAQLRGQTDLPHWVLRDERFRNLLKEAERQTRQTKFEHHQEQAAEKMLKKASKEIYQLRGQNQKEPIQTRQTKFEHHQEQAAEKMLKKASKEIYQLRGQNQKEPIQVQTF